MRPKDLQDWNTGDARISHYNLASKSYSFSQAKVGELPYHWNGGSPGTAVVGNIIYAFGRNGFYSYDPDLQVKRILIDEDDFSGYETSLCPMSGNGDFIALSRLYGRDEVQIVKITGFGKLIEILGNVSVLTNENRSSQVWGWFWDSNNNVLARMFNGKYEWISPEMLEAGDLAHGLYDIGMPGDQTAFFHCVDRPTDDAIVYCTKEGGTFALGIPVMSIRKTAPLISGSIPFGDLRALKADGLIPNYTDKNLNVPLEQLALKWGHDTGGRSEIGLDTAWVKKWVATEDPTLLNLIITQALNQAEQWHDYNAVMRPIRLGGNMDLSFAHTPNAFFVPYLMTGNETMRERMELLWSHYCRSRNRPLNKRLDTLSGREYAWQLRNLAQLAILESYGKTERRIYRAALTDSLMHIVDIMQDPQEPHFNVFNIFEFNRGSPATVGFSGWMESFKGIVINWMISTGRFDDWRPVAEWHLQHLIKRSGSQWPLKAVDMDHAYFKDDNRNDITPLNWQTVTAYQNQTRAGRVTNELNIYNAAPDNQLLPIGDGLTFDSRAHLSWMWASMAAANGIAGARDKANEISAAIGSRGRDRRHPVVV